MKPAGINRRIVAAVLFVLMLVGCQNDPLAASFDVRMPDGSCAMSQPRLRAGRGVADHAGHASATIIER
jgi:hypothetical protein